MGGAVRSAPSGATAAVPQLAGRMARYGTVGHGSSPMGDRAVFHVVAGPPRHSPGQGIPQRGITQPRGRSRTVLTTAGNVSDDARGKDNTGAGDVIACASVARYFTRRSEQHSICLTTGRP